MFSVWIMLCTVHSMSSCMIHQNNEGSKKCQLSIPRTLTSFRAAPKSGSMDFIVSFYFMTSFQLNFLKLWLSIGGTQASNGRKWRAKRANLLPAFLPVVSDKNVNGSSKATQSNKAESVHFTHPIAHIASIICRNLQRKCQKNTQVIPRRKVHTQSFILRIFRHYLFHNCIHSSH